MDGGDPVGWRAHRAASWAQGRQIRDRMGLEGNQRLLLRGFVHPLWLSRTEQRWRPRLDIMQRNRHLRVTPFVLHPAPLLDFGGEGQF